MTNKTSEALYEKSDLSRLYMVEFQVAAHWQEWVAFAEKYKRYENYALSKAKEGDMEAQNVVDFDPLA